MRLDIDLPGSDSPVDDLDTVAQSLDSLAMLLAESPAFAGAGDGLALNLMLHTATIRAIAAALHKPVSKARATVG